MLSDPLKAPGCFMEDHGDGDVSRILTSRNHLFGREGSPKIDYIKKKKKHKTKSGYPYSNLSNL